MDIDALINKYSGTSSTAKAADGMPNIDDLARRYGSGSAPVVPQAAPIAAPTQVSTAPDNIPFDASQFSTSTPPQGNTQSQSGYLSNAVYGVERLFKEAPKGPGIGGGFAKKSGENFRSSISGLGSDLGNAFEQATSNRPLSALGSVGHAGLNALGVVAGPISAATDEFIKEPVSRMFGPETGARAEFAASSAIPIMPGGRIVNNARPSTKAFNSLVDAIGPENIASTVNALKENPRLSIADVAEGARRRGQRLAVVEGPHQPSFDKFVNDRTIGAKAAVTDAYDTAMGTTVNVKDKLDELKQAARKVGKNDIEPALAKSGPVDVSPVLAHINNLEKPGLTSVVSVGDRLPNKAAIEEVIGYKPYLTDGKSVQTDPKILNSVQSGLRAKADNLLNSATKSDAETGYHLMQLRNKIVDAIDTASGGTYKPALAKYKDEKQIQAAFDRGYQLNRNPTNGSVWDNHPDFVADWVKNASKEELQAAREGARLAFRDAVGRSNNPRGLKGTETVNNEYNLEKARMLFGDKEINLMTDKLKAERNIAQTNQDFTQGSQTAFRNAHDSAIPERVGPGEKNPNTGSGLVKAGIVDALSVGGQMAVGQLIGTGPGFIPGIGAAGYAVAKGLGAAGGAVKRRIDNKLTDIHNTELSSLIQSTAANKELMDKLIERAPKPQLSTSKRAINALSRAVQPLLPP